LEVPVEVGMLKRSQPYFDIRVFFKESASEFGEIDFFVINPEFVSIGSAAGSSESIVQSYVALSHL
jgi:hypothetical protein